MSHQNDDPLGLAAPEALTFDDVLLQPAASSILPGDCDTRTSVTGSIELPADKEMVMPGDNVSIAVKLIAPIAMEEGLRFAIREGGRTVGAGVVAKILK